MGSCFDNEVLWEKSRRLDQSIRQPITSMNGYVANDSIVFDLYEYLATETGGESFYLARIAEGFIKLLVLSKIIEKLYRTRLERGRNGKESAIYSVGD